MTKLSDLVTGGLTVVPVTAAAISGTTLTNNKQYVIDMSAATGNITVNLPRQFP